MSLSLEHLEDLERSGLTSATVERMGVHSARPADLNKLAGWDITSRGVTSAMVFPYPDCDGFYQLKVFPAFRNSDGHHVKYIQPMGSESRAYILPDVRRRIEDPAESVIITEGVKKAARLAQEGFNAVGIPAVWNWKVGAAPYTDPASLIPDLKALVTAGRHFLDCFDSDVWDTKKPDCRLALYALMHHLERLGGKAAAVRLPGPTKEERAEGIVKIGADDFLCRHSVEAFRRLITGAIPPTHRVFKAAAEHWRKKELATRPFVERISALLAEPETDPEWLVDSLLARGDVGFIPAEPKLAKSWLAYLLSLCLATGQTFLDFKVPERRRVLLMSEEDSRRRLARRIRQLVAGLGGIRPEDGWLRFTSRTGFKLDVPEWVERLRVELAAFRPDVVIIDVLRRLHDLEENSNQDMGKLTNTLNDLRRDFGCGFLILHHNRKLAQGTPRRGRGGQEMSGAGVLHGWSEASLYLSKGSGKGKFIVTPEHKDVAEAEPFVIHLMDVPGGGVRIENEGPATVDKGAQTRAMLLEALPPESEGIGRNVKELSEALKFSLNTVRAHLKALREDGAADTRKPLGKQAVYWFRK
ncbi:MAG: AAA family ATPase [Candidatus Methylomirabilales bacterium]